MLENFTSDKFPNTHIEFSMEGMKLVVTLNIPSFLIKYLPKNKVQKKDKYYIYWMKDLVKNPTIGNVTRTYNQLMERTMTNVRNAKIQKLEDEKRRISQRTIIAI